MQLAKFVLAIVAVIHIGAGPAGTLVARKESLTSVFDRPPIHEAVARYKIGSGAQCYWLFEPDSPHPAHAPIVVFLHGWSFVNPGVYGAWIDHLVRQGTTVIFPRFQSDWTTRPDDFLPTTLNSVRDALHVLQTADGHVRPDQRHVTLIGHSIGADLAVRFAGVAKGAGLPVPRALILLMPGSLDSFPGRQTASISPTTLLVVAVADRDRLVGDHVAREIFDGAVGIAPARKRYIVYRSDLHGRPPLIADHMAPTASLPAFDSGEGPFHALQMAQANVNALDRLGVWRMADLTLAAELASKTFDDCLDRAATLCDLGRWADGQPIVSPIVTANASGIARFPPSLNARFLRESPPPPSSSIRSRGARDRAQPN